MPPQAQKYVITLICSAIVTLVLAIYSWRRREVKGANALAVLLFVVTGWTVVGALKWATNDLNQEIYLTQWGFIGGTTTPILLFIFILTYLNKDRFLTRRNIALLFLIPVTSIVLVWTNDSHHLIWSSAKLEYIQEGIENLAPSYSLFYWLQITYAYGLMMVGLGLLLMAYVKSTTFYRKQIGTLILGVLAPWAAHVVHLFTNIDLTHLSFSLAGLALMWNMFQHRLFDIVSIAQDTVIERLGDGVFVLSKEGVIRDLNLSAQEMLGVPRNLIIDQPMKKVFPQGVILDDIAPGRREIALNGRNGNGRRYYDTKISPILDEENRPQGEVLVLRDVTTRKEMEEKIALARDEAVAASKTKTYLLSNVTNDVREPLNAMLDYTELLKTGKRGDVNPKQENILENMLESGQQLLGFINRLVHQAQLETGQIRLNYGPINTKEIVAEAEAIARPLLQGKSLAFRASAALGMPDELQGDLYWLKQILANLLSNAAKYTEAGHIHVSLEPKNKSFWDLSVSDTGRGIPKESQEKIFEPFQRDESSLARDRDSGAGLGLAIVQQLTNLMGGEITLESAPGRGSTFTISLPFNTPEGNP